ncbi:hypothetical protein [Paenibacillus sp. Z3-2]
MKDEETYETKPEYLEQVEPLLQDLLGEEYTAIKVRVSVLLLTVELKELEGHPYDICGLATGH